MIGGCRKTAEAFDAWLAAHGVHEVESGQRQPGAQNIEQTLRRAGV